MAVVADTVVVELVAKLDRYNANVVKAENQFTRSMRRIESVGTRTASAVRNTFGAIGLAFGGAAALRGAQQLIDASTRVSNSLKVAGLAGAELESVYNDLYASAQRNAAPINALATLYSRAAAAQNELGASSEDLASFTDNVAKALRVAGTSSEEAQGALLQLGQALGSARVQAEEFNSINDGARPILQAAAAGIEEAAGSVAKLKQLVNDGEVSNKAFFDGIQAGAYILEDQLAGAELTVSQGFVRLQNVLIDAAKRFNETSGAGQRFVEFLDVLGQKITEIASSDEFEGWLNDLGDSFNETFGRDLRDIERVIGVIDEVKAAFDRFGPSVADTDLALAQAEQSLANFAAGTVGSMGEVDAAAQDLFQQVLEGKGSAELAAEAIEALGDANPDFRDLLNNIGAVIQKIYELRGAAIAATRPDVSGNAPSYAGQDAIRPPTVATTPPISLADYPVVGGGSGKGSSKATPQETFAKAVQGIKDQTAALGLQQAALNQTTFEIERARIAQELLNDARDAGVTITPEITASINETAEAYARAAESLETMTELQEQFTQIATASLTSFISDLREGKSAAEALSNVFDQLAQQLINIAIQGLVQQAFGGIFGGGGGIFGSLFGGRGFASGTANTGGSRGQPMGVVHGQEAVIPLPSGGKVPVQVTGGAGGGGTVAVEVVPSEYFDVKVRTISGQVSTQVTSAGLTEYDRNLQSTMADKQARYG